MRTMNRRRERKDETAEERSEEAASLDVNGRNSTHGNWRPSSFPTASFCTPRLNIGKSRHSLAETTHVLVRNMKLPT